MCTTTVKPTNNENDRAGARNVAKLWYQEGAELFTELTSTKQFDDIVTFNDDEHQDKLIVVEFYARSVG
jgi:hypothetical protein